MNRDDFEMRLIAASYWAWHAMQRYVIDRLPPEFRYDLALRTEDGDNLNAGTNLLASDVIVKVMKDDKVPVWIDIMVDRVENGNTVFSLECSDRYESDETKLYYTWCGSAPFGIKCTHLPRAWSAAELRGVPPMMKFRLHPNLWNRIWDIVLLRFLFCRLDPEIIEAFKRNIEKQFPQRNHDAGTKSQSKSVIWFYARLVIFCIMMIAAHAIGGIPLMEITAVAVILIYFTIKYFIGKRSNDGGANVETKEEFPVHVNGCNMEECVFFDAEQMIESGVGIVAPTGLKTSHDVFAFYSKALSFPDYFGWNWDAFDECIKDLSWIENGTVHIIHDEIPLKLDPHECAIFLSSIHEVKFHFRTKGKLAIHFRASDKHEILDALFRYYRELKYYHTNKYLEFYHSESRWNDDPEAALAAIDKGLAIMYRVTGF